MPAVFEEIRLLGRRREGILLQTRRPRDIPNVVEPHPPPASVQAKFWRLRKSHPLWEVRKGPTGIYNCVGHVWASRRTSVFTDLEQWVLTIREDDGYRIVDLRRERPASGDVIAYWESVQPYKTFLHLGIVEMRQGVTPESPIAWVSKPKRPAPKLPAAAPKQAFAEWFRCKARLSDFALELSLNYRLHLNRSGCT
jgi:hypothetical protein